MRRIGSLVLCVALIVAVPAAAKDSPIGDTPAKDKPAKEKELVSVAAAGTGIAPGAPDWVRRKVAEIHAGKKVDGEFEPGTARAPQSARRISWSGCRDVWAYRGYNHTLGYNLFRYYQMVSWCSNGLWITSWSRFRWAELNAPGWAFDGHLDSYLGGTSQRKRAWTQGQFRACYFGWCDYKVPWVNIEVDVWGNYSYATGG